MNMMINPYAFAAAAPPPEDIIYAFTDLLSVARASAGYAQTTAGALTSFAANTLRITDKGLLVEEARTNYLLRSQEIDNASWTKEGLPVTADAVAAPDGTTTADTVTVDGTTSYHRFYENTFTLLQPTGSVTVSIHAKAGTHSWFGFSLYNGRYAFFNVTTGAAGSTDAVGGTVSRIEALAGGWYRCSASYPVATGGSSGFCQVFLTQNDAAAATPPTYAGSSTTMHLWGLQFEHGPYPTSYIPTTTAAVTRAADVVTLIGDAKTAVNSTTASAVFSMDIMPEVTNVGRFLHHNAHATLYKSATTSLTSHNGTVTLAKTGLTAHNTIASRYGLAWSPSGRAVTGQGLTVASDANVLDTAGTTWTGSNHLGGDSVNTYVKQLKVWDARLSNADLVTETT